MMKLSTVVTCSTGLRLLVVWLMLCASVSHISAKDEARIERRFEDPDLNRVSADEAEIREKIRPFRLNQGQKSEIEKRLNALEKRYVFSVSLLTE